MVLIVEFRDLLVVIVFAIEMHESFEGLSSLLGVGMEQLLAHFRVADLQAHIQMFLMFLNLNSNKIYNDFEYFSRQRGQI